MIHIKYDPGLKKNLPYIQKECDSCIPCNKQIISILVSCNLPEIAYQCSLHVLVAVGLLFEDP